jgi:hypothetical protein
LIVSFASQTEEMPGAGSSVVEGTWLVGEINR